MFLQSFANRILRVVSCVLLMSAIACGVMVWRTRPALSLDDPASDRSTYSQCVSAHYNYRFGADKPFLPSNATTDDGEFIDPKSFPTAKYCGHCHQAAYAEWRQTAHANSFRAPWYIKNTNMLKDTKGIEYTRHCEGCHNPIALTSGALNKGSSIDRHFDQDGVTCSVCHSIQKVDTRGTGSYVIA